jgi:hypothetical protein
LLASLARSLHSNVNTLFFCARTHRSRSSALRRCGTDERRRAACRCLGREVPSRSRGPRCRRRKGGGGGGKRGLEERPRKGWGCGRRGS